MRYIKFGILVRGLSSDFYTLGSDNRSACRRRIRSIIYQTGAGKRRLFSEINAYISSDIDPGVITVAG